MICPFQLHVGGTGKPDWGRLVKARPFLVRSVSLPNNGKYSSNRDAAPSPGWMGCKILSTSTALDNK